MERLMMPPVLHNLDGAIPLLAPAFSRNRHRALEHLFYLQELFLERQVFKVPSENCPQSQICPTTKVEATTLHQFSRLLFPDEPFMHTLTPLFFAESGSLHRRALTLASWLDMNGIFGQRIVLKMGAIYHFFASCQPQGDLPEDKKQLITYLEQNHASSWLLIILQHEAFEQKYLSM
jgi:hypothetical protein